MSYKFNPSLSGLKTVNSDYIYNSYDILNYGNFENQGNLTISGILQSPVTSLLGVSSGIIDNKIYNLNVSSGILDNKIYNLGVSSGIIDNKIYNLNVSSGTIDNKIYNLNVSSGIIDNKVFTLGVSHTNLNLDLQTTKSLLQFTDTFLQNQIDTLILLGITGTNIDVLFGISGTIWDSKIYTLGVSSGILDGKVYDNSLDIITLQNLSVSFDNRITTNESDIYNLNVTTNLSLDRITGTETELVNIDTRLSFHDLKWGTTGSLSVTSITIGETLFETADDIKGYINDGLTLMNSAHNTYVVYNEVRTNGLQATLSSHLGEWTGYQVLQEETDALQTTNIATNTGGIVINSGLIAANLVAIGTLTAGVGTNSLDISNLGVSTSNLSTYDGILGVSVGVLDSFKNSFSLSTTTHLNSIDSSITNLGTSWNTNNTRLTNYEDRIDLNTLDITFKGSTLNSMILTDSGLSITGNLTVSGTLQSPLTSLLSVSSGILDTFRMNMLNVSMPQYLTRNETVLPSSFLSSSITKLGVSAIIGKAGTDSVKYDFQVGSDGSTNSNPRDTAMVISSGGENKNAWLILGTPNNPSDGVRAMKTAIIAEGLSSYSRNKLHFCMNKTLNNNETTGNVSLNDSLVSLDYNGLLTVTGNLTVSGVLQSPLTSLLSVSSGVLDTFRVSMLNTTMPLYLTRNETVVPSSFTSSSLSTNNGTFLKQVGPSTDSYSLFNCSGNTSTNVVGIVGGTNMLLKNSTPGGSLILMTGGHNDRLNIDSSGGVVITGNLTVSGVLQSPITNLLGVSSGIIDGKVYNLGISHVNLSSYVYSLNNSTLGVSINNNTTAINTNTGDITTLGISHVNLSSYVYSLNNSTLGVSVGNNTTGINTLNVSSGILDTFRTSMISVSMPQYLTRNETVVPSSFLSSSLTSLGTLTKLGVNKTSSAVIPIMVKGTSAGTGSIHISPTSTGTENTIYFANNATSTTYDTGTAGTWVVGNNIAGNDSNSFSIWNPNLGVKNFKLDINGHALFINNLTVSGALQSPLTSLLGVSISNLSSGNIGNTWGTTGAEKIVNTASYLEVNAQDVNNSYMRFKNTGNGNYSLFGQIDNDDTFIRQNNAAGIFKIQNSSGVNKFTLDTNGNTVISGTLNSGAISSGAITSTGASSFGSDTLITSGGNCSFKMTGGSFTYRYETQTNDTHYLWDGANQEIYHISSDNQVWFQADVNTTGGFYSNGIPITSSRKLKSNIKEIEETDDIFNKIRFRKYNKKIKDNEVFEYGIIADEIQELDPENNYGLWEQKEVNGEMIDFIHYLKIFNLACNEIQKLRIELDELKTNLKK